jgi:glycosyltransferase involved in cell wall biosynthesis
MLSRRVTRIVGERESPRGDNLHISPTPVVNASRVLKQTLSVASSGLFSSVVICGMAQDGLPHQENLPNGRRIDRVGGTVHGRSPSTAGRIVARLSWSIAVFRQYSQSDVRVINAHSVAALPVCYLLGRRLGAKLIYDTHELETETPTSTGVQRLIFKVVEQLLITKCDAVFVVNQSIADWYQRRYRGVRPVVVRNISNVEGSKRRIDLRAMLPVPAGKRLFVFVGNFTGWRNIHAILDTFAGPAVDDHIVFIGGGGELDSLVSEYCAGHQNIHRLPAVPPTEVVSYAAGGDVGLCLTQPSCLSHKLSLPNKAFEYTQAGTPFLFTDLPEVARLLGPAFARWRVDDTASDLVEAITALTAETIEEGRTNMARIQIPSWDEEAAAMMAVYSALVS